MSDITYCALNEPFNIANRVEAFGTMWAKVSGTLPTDEEEKKDFEDTVVVKTAPQLLALKRENTGNTFVLGERNKEFVVGTHYRAASTMSPIQKMSVLMFYCMDDYAKDGLGDRLLEFLLNIGMNTFSGKPVEFSVKAVTKRKGIPTFFKRHGFELDLSATVDTRPSWYTKTIEF